MHWIEFINSHKTLLKANFPNGCERCIYGRIWYNTYAYIEDTNTFSSVLCEETELTDYKMKNLCSECVLDKDRDVCRVLFDILCYLLETRIISNFSVALSVLNKGYLIPNPKEILFIHYIKKSAHVLSVEPYMDCIRKLLELRISESYPYSKASRISGPISYTILPVHVVTESTKAISHRVLELLRENNYKFHVTIQGQVIMTNLVSYIING